MKIAFNFISQIFRLIVGAVKELRCDKAEIEINRHTAKLKVSMLQWRCKLQPTLYNLGVMLKQKALDARRH